jgi:hypothetical protein
VLETTQSFSVGDSGQQLLSELERAITHHARWAHFNERTALLLLIVAVAASALAGIGGIVLGLDTRIIGTIASLPALIALVVSAFKFEAHAD